MPKRTSNPAYLTARKQILAGNPACYWCGNPATEADHIIEHDRGGTDTTDNLVPSCNCYLGRISGSNYTHSF